jgi:squalene synthase HpnC
LHFFQSCAEIDTVTRGVTPVSPGRGPLSLPRAKRWRGTAISSAPETPAAAGSQTAGSQTAGSQTAVVTAGAAAQAPAENFPVALRLLPERYRRHLMAVYTFARTVDDIGDEALPAAAAGRPAPAAAGRPAPAAARPAAAPARPAPAADQNDGATAAERIRLLDELDDDLARLYRGESPRLEVIGQLAATVAACGIPAQPLRDLIQANRQDQIVRRYQTFDDLTGYCELSANPVGRLVLHVFGAYSPRRAALSDHVCTALQLAEHWQDVAEDYQNGRIYLPAEDLARFGVTEQALAGPAAGPEVRALMSFQVARASALLSAGSPLIATLRGAARVAVAGYVAGGRAALAAIEAAGYDVLAATPRPARPRLLAELARAYTRGR